MSEPSPIQVEDLNGRWVPKGTLIRCARCGANNTTGVDMLLLPNEGIVCHGYCKNKPL